LASGHTGTILLASARGLHVLFRHVAAPPSATKMRAKEPQSCMPLGAMVLVLGYAGLLLLLLLHHHPFGGHPMFRAAAIAPVDQLGGLAAYETGVAVAPFADEWIGD
jgi:hypothetical protein